MAESTHFHEPRRPASSGVAVGCIAVAVAALLLLVCGGVGVFFWSFAPQAQQVAIEAREAAEAARIQTEQALEQAKIVGIDDFVVEDATISMDENGGTSPERMIEVTVHNGTGRLVQRVHFVWMLRLPDGQVLAEGQPEYAVSEGLPPGEKATWRIAPNVQGALRPVDEHRDAVLEVDVIGVESAEGSEGASSGDADQRGLVGARAPLYGANQGHGQWAWPITSTTKGHSRRTHWPDSLPKLAEGIFAAVWTLEYAIAGCALQHSFKGFEFSQIFGREAPSRVQ